MGVQTNGPVLTPREAPDQAVPWWAIQGTVELEPEVRDWLESLPARQFATAAFYIDLVADRGPPLGEPYTRQLDGKLRELRSIWTVVRSG